MNRHAASVVLMTNPFMEAKEIKECTICGTRSVWRTNNRVIYPDSCVYCAYCQQDTFHKRIKVGRWRIT